jgi:uncharacterized protein YbbC (DUF1343 family)
MKMKITIFMILLFVINAKAIDYTKAIVAAEKTNEYLPLLKDKKIAVVGNQTSMIKNTHLVDSLISLKINVVKIFSPEHGFRGIADAGETIKSGIDTKTGLPVVSLYGNHKNPTAEDLKNIDIVLFDIQDVGVRFYTYISTLQYVMEACAENNVEILILDRPNPNGFYVDGPVLKPKFKSFIGMQPIPIVHGMTIAEYAKMINEEGWLKDGKKCKLTYVTCDNWDHTKFYELPVKPSPNLPNMVAVFYYPTIGLLEGTVMSVGRGTEAPFQFVGHPDLMDGYVEFTPKSMDGAKKPKFEGVKCKGYDARDNGIDYIVEKKGIGLPCLVKAYAGMSNTDDYFTNSFDLLAGNSELKEQIKFRMQENEVRKTWENDINAFKLIRAKYLLYKDFE